MEVKNPDTDARSIRINDGTGRDGTGHLTQLHEEMRVKDPARMPARFGSTTGRDPSHVFA